ncbi:MAG: 4Fe-4S ferredoxin, partial [Deltaproteobacteria bacterium CG_4_8_14_3_um_filter_43_13]
MKAGKIRLKDIGKPSDQMVQLNPADFMRLPYPYDKADSDPDFKQLTEAQKNKYEASLDGVLAISIPKPETKAEEEELVRKFLSGLEKLLTKENNWTFLQPLTLSLEYCAKCQTCNEACPIYIGSGKQEIYRPTYRSEVLRAIVNKYIKKGGKTFAKFSGNDIDLNWTTVARLAELAYRCTLCRRCAQTCPIGVDNGLITHELRKVFSQEMGIAPVEIHTLGSMKHLKAGSSTGLTPVALMDTIEFLEDDIKDRTGLDIKFPMDKEGADILLIHNAGEFLSWPENPMAFAIIFEAAGLNWTLSSDLLGYDAVNYGLWYDDVQFARVAVRHAQIAKKLGVKKIVIGECGHAHKAISVTADRIINGEINIPRESSMTLLEDLVCKGKLNLDPKRNDFPVTLHDPCNMVRLMGVVEPQRRVVRKICPQFREMEPHGVKNYCCGGGSGFAIMPSMNFPDWRTRISGRMKFKQILDAFQ